MPNDERDSEHQGFQNYDASRTESIRDPARDVPTHHAIQLAGLYRPYPTLAVYGRVAPSSANYPKLEFVLADGTLVGRKTVSFLPSYSTKQKRKARASVLQQHADTEEPLATTLPTHLSSSPRMGCVSLASPNQSTTPSATTTPSKLHGIVKRYTKIGDTEKDVLFHSTRKANTSERKACRAASARFLATYSKQVSWQAIFNAVTTLGRYGVDEQSMNRALPWSYDEFVLSCTAYKNVVERLRLPLPPSVIDYANSQAVDQFVQSRNTALLFRTPQSEIITREAFTNAPHLRSCLR